MKIAIVGAGGVGGYFGGRLAQAGYDVVFLVRGKTLAAIQKNGLKIESINGDAHIDPVKVSDDPAAIGTVDYIIMGVKAWQIPEAAKQIQPLVGPDATVLPLQNGVEAPGQLASVLGKKHVLGGLCKIISFVVEPGYIRHIGAEPNIALGELDNEQSSRAEKLRDAFIAAGVMAKIPSDIQVAMWDKFLFITAVSGIGAVTGQSIGEFRADPARRNQLEKALQEILALAHARNVPLAETSVSRNLRFIDSLPLESTASMQRDIMAGRPSELENLTGAVVRLGIDAGVPTPVNSEIYARLKPREDEARAAQ